MLSMKKMRWDDGKGQGLEAPDLLRSMSACQSAGLTVAGCSEDCGFLLTECPSSGGGQCSGVGWCMSSQGICQCYLGYAGASCDKCDEGYTRSPPASLPCPTIPCPAHPTSPCTCCPHLCFCLLCCVSMMIMHCLWLRPMTMVIC